MAKLTIKMIINPIYKLFYAYLNYDYFYVAFEKFSNFHLNFSSSVTQISFQPFLHSFTKIFVHIFKII